MNGVRLGSIGDIPLFVSPWYVILALYSAAMIGDVAFGGLWVLCLTVSLLVHELGHATVARRLRLQPRILLHGFGGLCAHDRAERDRDDVWIIASGPGAGLLLGAIFWGAWRGLVASGSPLLAEPMIAQGIRWMIWLNITWSLVNLIPLWPLDGGQLFRLGMLRIARPARAEQITHGVGIALAVAAVAASAALGFGRFTMLLAGLIGWLNFQALRGDRSSGPIRSQSRVARELVGHARDAFARGDWSETARLCHQVRAEPRVQDAMLDEVWRLLGLATANAGKDREAVSYLRRAPLDPVVGEAWLRSLLNLEADDEIRELLQSEEWRRLGARGQAIVDRLASEA